MKHTVVVWFDLPSKNSQPHRIWYTKTSFNVINIYYHLKSALNWKLYNEIVCPLPKNASNLACPKVWHEADSKIYEAKNWPDNIIFSN